MLLRDRLQRRLDGMGAAPDYVRVVEEVFGLRNVPAALAKRMVTQGLVVEDRRETWRLAGERISAAAPVCPGVYLLKDETGEPVYVGKAVNLRRRLRAHFAPTRWPRLSPEMARVVDAGWQETGSELECLLLEAEWIRTLMPPANIQIAPPALDTRVIPPSIMKNTIVLVPSPDPAAVHLVAASTGGRWRMERAARDGGDLPGHAHTLWEFFFPSSADRDEASKLAPIVFSWLAHRGQHATRVVVSDVDDEQDLARRLEIALTHRDLFAERIVVL